MGHVHAFCDGDYSIGNRCNKCLMTWYQWDIYMTLSCSLSRSVFVFVEQTAMTKRNPEWIRWRPAVINHANPTDAQTVQKMTVNANKVLINSQWPSLLALMEKTNVVSVQWWIISFQQVYNTIQYNYRREGRLYCSTVWEIPPLQHHTTSTSIFINNIILFIF